MWQGACGGVVRCHRKLLNGACKPPPCCFAPAPSRGARPALVPHPQRSTAARTCVQSGCTPCTRSPYGSISPRSRLRWKLRTSCCRPSAAGAGRRVGAKAGRGTGERAPVNTACGACPPAAAAVERRTGRVPGHMEPGHMRSPACRQRTSAPAHRQARHRAAMQSGGTSALQGKSGGRTSVSDRGGRPPGAAASRGKQPGRCRSDTAGVQLHLHSAALRKGSPWTHRETCSGTPRRCRPPRAGSTGCAPRPPGRGQSLGAGGGRSKGRGAKVTGAGPQAGRAARGQQGARAAMQVGCLAKPPAGAPV